MNRLLPVILLFQLSCLSLPDKPVLNTDQMAGILADLYYLEAAVEPLSLHIRDSVLQAGRLEILSRHGTNDTLFEQSSVYFKAHARDLKEIEDKVVRILEAKEKVQGDKPDGDN
jgi:hypothetical protein